MTTLEWTYTIVLIVAIVLSLTLCTIALRRTIKEGFSGRWGSILVLAVGTLFIAYLIYHTREIEPADWAQIMLMTGLVAITGLYALSTAKMAGEMREQRYDAVRPVIDIEESLTDEDKREILSNVRKGKLPQQLTCTLRNIGPGPAIDVYSLTEGAKGESQRYDIGSMATNDKEREITRRLSLERNGGRGFLVAYYKDVYDRDIESRREVSIAQVSGGWEIGPLKTEVRKIAKEEHTK